MKKYLASILFSSFSYLIAHDKDPLEQKHKVYKYLDQDHYDFEKEENNQKLEQTKTVIEYVDELYHQGKKVRLIIGESNTDTDILDRFDEGCIFLDIEQSDKEMKNRSLKGSFVDIQELKKLSKDIGGKIDQIIFDNSVMKYEEITKEVLECYKDMLKNNGEFIYRFSIASFGFQNTINFAIVENNIDNKKNSLLSSGWTFFGASKEDRNNIKRDILENNHKRILKSVFKNIEEKEGFLPFKEREYMYDPEDPIIICYK